MYQGKHTLNKEPHLENDTGKEEKPKGMVLSSRIRERLFEEVIFSDFWEVTEDKKGGER